MDNDHGHDDDCPDPNDIALFAEMDRDRVDLTMRFDLSDGPEPHQRKSEVRLLLDVLDKPSLMTNLQVMRACATPQILDGETTKLVMKPNGVRSSSRRVPILGRIGESFPIRANDPRWPPLGKTLSNAKAALVAALPALALDGLNAPVNWPKEVVHEARRFLRSESSDRRWPAFPESWRRWKCFVELDPVLTKAFYFQANRYFHDRNRRSYRDDLVAMIREEAFLTGICNAGRRQEKSDDLRGGILGKALESSARRLTDKIRERSGPGSSMNANGAPARVQRVALADEKWKGMTECSEKDQWARRIMEELKLECTDLEWVIWDCHFNFMKAPDIVAALQPIVTAYEELARALEAGRIDLKPRASAAPRLPADIEDLLDFSSLAAAMRHEAGQLRLDESGVRDIIHRVRQKAEDIVMKND